LKTHFISYYVILRFIYKHYLYIIYNYTNKNFTLSITIKKLKIQNIYFLYLKKNFLNPKFINSIHLSVNGRISHLYGKNLGFKKFFL